MKIRPALRPPLWSNGLRIVAEEEKRPAGCSFPIRPKRKNRRKAKVMAVGPGAKAAPDGRQVDRPRREGPATRILFGKYSGSEIKLDGEEFLIMREDEVPRGFSTAAPKKGQGLRF